MSEPLTVQTISSDRAIMTLLAVKEKKSMQEIAAILGLSLGMVQRYYRFLLSLNYIQRQMYPSGRKAVSRGTSLTKKGEEVLRLYGHSI